MSGKIQTKQSLLSPRLSSSHQIPKCHSYLILSYPISILSASHSIFHSFITSLISVYFVVIKKLFFNQYIKKLLKWRNDWLWIYSLLHYFPMLNNFSNSNNFFPTPTYDWLTIMPVYIICRLKRMIKSEEIDWLKSSHLV